MAKKKPQNKADDMEKVTQLVAEKLFERRKNLLKSVGPRPFLGSEVDAEDSFTQYSMVRHNKELWKSVLLNAIREKNDGAMLVPKELVAAVKEFESRFTAKEEVGD